MEADKVTELTRERRRPELETEQEWGAQEAQLETLPKRAEDIEQGRQHKGRELPVSHPRIDEVRIPEDRVVTGRQHETGEVERLRKEETQRKLRDRDRARREKERRESKRLQLERDRERIRLSREELVKEQERKQAEFKPSREGKAGTLDQDRSAKRHGNEVHLYEQRMPQDRDRKEKDSRRRHRKDFLENNRRSKDLEEAKNPTHGQGVSTHDPKHILQSAPLVGPVGNDDSDAPLSSSLRPSNFRNSPNHRPESVHVPEQELAIPPSHGLLTQPVRTPPAVVSRTQGPPHHSTPSGSPLYNFHIVPQTPQPQITPLPSEKKLAPPALSSTDRLVEVVGELRLNDPVAIPSVIVSHPSGGNLYSTVPVLPDTRASGSQPFQQRDPKMSEQKRSSMSLAKPSPPVNFGLGPLPPDYPSEETRKRASFVHESPSSRPNAIVQTSSPDLATTDGHIPLPRTHVQARHIRSQSDSQTRLHQSTVQQSSAAHYGLERRYSVAAEADANQGQAVAAGTYRKWQR
ncbi:hypothetical protein EST38_g11129 [Candolleomyces aberdarensis]|uniref:Uncharacterized protein n=1 Tax=Candolleomyces aberdarensis TaxID=2316362 RepID=A0A4Q2D5M8_9AGAR|nr:hypothetical protein EST38_g11129 [Candolleomyces aberdarensis]